MKRSRGLTLIEVLASILILSLLAATCVPMLRDSMRALRHTADAAIYLTELSGLADDVMDNPAPFGIEAWELTTEQTLPWPDQPDRSSVEVAVLRTTDAQIDHVWVLFEWEEHRVSRWAPIESEPEGSP